MHLFVGVRIAVGSYCSGLEVFEIVFKRDEKSTIVALFEDVMAGVGILFTLGTASVDLVLNLIVPEG